MSVIDNKSTQETVLPLSPELRYEEEAVNWDKNIRYGKKRLAQIYTEWSFEVARRFSLEGTPQGLVCSHIKNRLRIRGCSEGSIDYVAETLASDFKDKRFDSSENRQYSKDGNPSLSPVYEDLDSKAKAIHYGPDIERLSLAEMEEIIPRCIDLKKSMIKELREEVAMAKQKAMLHQIKIPDVEKISADEPPEYFHGQSELLYSVQGFNEELRKMLNQGEDLADRIQKFKPTKEVAQICADKFEQFKQAGFQKMRMLATLYMKMHEDILTPYTDLKWANNLTEWLQMTDDRAVKYGNKGCGTKHAVPTGQFVLKKYKDGHVDLIGIKREYTREQVCDKAKKQMVKIALTNILANPLEQALDYWADNTLLIEQVEK